MKLAGVPKLKLAGVGVKMQLVGVNLGGIRGRGDAQALRGKVRDLGTRMHLAYRQWTSRVSLSMRFFQTLSRHALLALVGRWSATDSTIRLE